jgi:hypothetical protein
MEQGMCDIVFRCHELIKTAREKQKELDDLKKQIRDLMDKYDISDLVGIDGHVTRLRPKWSVDKLRKTYSARVFRVLCPPTPDNQALVEKFNAVKGDAQKLALLLACGFDGSFEVIMEEKDEN